MATKKNGQKTINVTVAREQNYHERDSYYTNYAFQGFKSNKLFTTDRFIKLDDNFMRLDGKTLKGYGLEIETGCAAINNQTAYANVLSKIIFPLFPEDLFKMQHDGSLRGASATECITQVMTKECIRNLYPAFKAMYNDYFKMFQISCSNPVYHCGMHVNISRACLGSSEKEQIETARKIYYFINKYYKLSCKLFARNIDCTEWCGRMSRFNDSKTINFNDLIAMGSHNVCLNYSHWNEGSGRIEIRLVGGQKDYFCFRNSMETIFFLVDALRDAKWSDLDNLTKLFSGCNQFVFKRLSTECSEWFDAASLAEINASIKTLENVQ